MGLQAPRFEIWYLQLREGAAGSVERFLSASLGILDKVLLRSSRFDPGRLSAPNENAN
jgi:hypothetical protein